MINLIKEYKAHLFIDEWNVNSNPGDMDKLKHIAEIVPKTPFVWMALSGSRTASSERFPEEFDDFYGPELVYSMRNSAEIVEHVNRLGAENNVQVSPVPPFFPEGCKPVKKLHSIEKAFKKAQSETKNGTLFIIESYFYVEENYKKDDINFILKRIACAIKNSCDSEKYRVAAYFNSPKLQFSRDQIPEKIHIANSTDCFEYLKKQNHFLITDENTAEGFEWPTVISYRLKDIQKPQNHLITVPVVNTRMRCIANLIEVEDAKTPNMS